MQQYTRVFCCRLFR